MADPTSPRESEFDIPADAGRSDRRDQDGASGRGDMLGGLSTGAGDRLGVSEPDDSAAEHEFEPGPISGHQHDLDAGEPRTDSATTYHGIDEGGSPTEGA